MGIAFLWRAVPLFLGRVLLRFCPESRGEEPCSGCELRVLCKCAQEDFQAANRAETIVWAALALCGAAVMVWCFV